MNNSWFLKDKSGQAWFLGIYSNNFEDREHETFTWDSHLEYAKWVSDMGVKLPVTVAHQPKYPPEVHIAQLVGLISGKFTPQEFSDNYLKLYKPFAFAQTETIIPLKGFMLVVAKILKGKEDAVKLLTDVNWGMSHGFLAIDRDEDTIKQYRSFEFTSLPPSMAANMFTVSSIKDIGTMDATKGLNDKDRETLKNLLDADPNTLEEGLGEMQRILSTVFNSKELDTEVEEDSTQEEEAQETSEYEEVRTKIFADLGVEELHKAFGQIIEKMTAVEQRLADHDARIKSTERSDDERVADTLFKPNWNMWDKSTEEDEPDNADELKEKALGEKPVDGLKGETNTDNPLVFGWQNLMFGEQQ